TAVEAIERLAHDGGLGAVRSRREGEQRGTRRFEPRAPRGRRGERSLPERQRGELIEDARRGARVAQTSERHPRLERERIAPEPPERATRERGRRRPERQLADEVHRLLLVLQRGSGMRSRSERDQNA